MKHQKHQTADEFVDEHEHTAVGQADSKAQSGPDCFWQHSERSQINT